AKLVPAKKFPRLAKTASRVVLWLPVENCCAQKVEDESTVSGELTEGGWSRFPTTRLPARADAGQASNTEIIIIDKRRFVHCIGERSSSVVVTEIKGGTRQAHEQNPTPGDSRSLAHRDLR